jgi:hypothetical protein
MIIIPKTSPKIMWIGIEPFYGCTSLQKSSWDFVKIGVYIIHKLYRSLTLFLTTQLKLWSLYTLKYFIGYVHLNSTHNLTFTFLLTNGDSHCHLLWKKTFLF